MRVFTPLVLMVLLIFPASAQPDPTVNIEATDGLTLHADYYPAMARNAPAVVLLHQLYTNRTSWDDVIPAFRAAGYAVLVPDLRGFGETRGNIDWNDAQDDTQLWINWLREQRGIRADRVVLLGSSMGANLAIIGCANDNVANPEDGCPTVVAISPGRDYYGKTPLAPALEAGLAARPVLFVTSEGDNWPVLAVEELTPDFPQITVRWLDGNGHGIDLLGETLVAEIIDWTNSQLPE